MEHHAATLREIAEKMALPAIKRIAAQPGLMVAYRVTLHYGDFRASSSITTLKRQMAQDIYVEVVYLHHFEHKPMTRVMPAIDFERFTAALNNLNFDKLPDQDHVPFFGTDLCMVERGAGSFIKSVIFAPDRAEGKYISLWNAICAYLPEALREL